jgi:hypothetical protein
MKKIFLSIASIFLIWQSYLLITQIHNLETQYWGSLIFVGWIINMFVTGIFAFVGFAFPTERLLPKSYYQVRQPKQIKKWFKTLRVEGFRKFLLLTFWRNKNQQKRYFDGTKAGFDNFVTQSKKSEFGHFLSFIIITFITIYLITIGLWKLAIPTILFNIIGNFYPILLQRHHRMRIERIKNRFTI